jgi:hypothetical protein
MQADCEAFAVTDRAASLPTSHDVGVRATSAYTARLDAYTPVSASVSVTLTPVRRAVLKMVGTPLDRCRPASGGATTGTCAAACQPSRTSANSTPRPVPNLTPAELTSWDADALSAEVLPIAASRTVKVTARNWK